MQNNYKEVSMGFTRDLYPAGTHMCLIYSDDPERLMEYEAMVNDVLVTHPITAICQYDANCFDGATILDVLRVHPMMIVQGQIVRNYYYMKPEDFIKDYTGGK
jgi:hypothetical protein